MSTEDAKYLRELAAYLEGLNSHFFAADLWAIANRMDKAIEVRDAMIDACEEIIYATSDDCDESEPYEWWVAGAATKAENAMNDYRATLSQPAT